MIDWIAVKQAADIVAPDEGFIDNNRKMNPIPVDPMKQIRNQALQQKMVEVPKAYVKGVAQDITNPQAWRDAVHSVGTQWNRGFRMMKPMAHLLYKEPISMFGKGVASLGQKAGWITPQQAAQQKATWDWWTQPQREQMEAIRQRFPYAERLENNPFYTAPASLLEESIAPAGLGTVAKNAARIARVANNKIGALVHGSSPDSIRAGEISWSDPVFMEKMRKRPEYRKLVEKSDRALELQKKNWNIQQARLKPRPVTPYLREHGLPEYPERVHFYWGDRPLKDYQSYGAQLKRRQLMHPHKPRYTFSNGYGQETRLRKWWDPQRKKVIRVPFVKETDSYKHERGHLEDFVKRFGNGDSFPRRRPGIVTDLRTIKNPWNGPAVMDEVAADTYAFASPKTGKLSRFAQLRHHPAIQTYLTWEKIAALERMKQRGKTLSEAATAAAGAYPFLNTDDPSKP